MVDELGLKQNEKKLVLTLQDTKNYVLHYKNLQFLSQPGYKTKEGPQGVGIRSRVLDGIAHPHEYRIRKQAQNEFKNNF